MPKLVIEIEHEFNAGPFIAIQGGKSAPLKAKQLKKMLEHAQPSDFSLSVSLLDPEEGWPSVGFEFTPAGLKTGSIFEYSIDEKSMRAHVNVKGTLLSSPLRSGVAPHIQKQGSKADFRLQAFNFKDGEWSGFTAPIIGQVEDEFKKWFRVAKWALK